MPIKFLEEIEDVSLIEYTSDSQYEPYKGIVLDPEDNTFKVMSGMFRDKKDFYEKMHKRGLILRKCFEKSVFDWIMENAKSTLDAYLLTSTAFSKWRGNNILSDYYVKILNDIPQLNRERQKGNPNSKGKSKKGWGEAVLQEDQPKQFYSHREIDTDGAIPHKLSVFPIGHNGERDPKYANKPIEIPVTLFDTEDARKKFDDPNFYRQMFKLMKIDLIGGGTHQKPILHPAFDIIIDGDFNNPTRLTSAQLLGSYATKNKNPYYQWGPNLKDGDALHSVQRFLTKNIAKAKEMGADQAEIQAAETQLKDLNTRISQHNKETYINYKTPKGKTLKDLKTKLYNVATQAKIEKWKNPETIAKLEDLKKQIAKLETSIQGLSSKNPKSFKPVSDDQSIHHSVAKQINDLQDRIAHLDKGFTPSNPAFGGDSEGDFLSKLDSKAHLQKKLDKLLKAQKLGNMVKVNPKKEIPNSTKFGIKSESRFGKIVEDAVNSGAQLKYQDQMVAQNPMTTGIVPLGGQILADATTHSELNQDLFNENKLKPEIRDGLLNIASKFEETLEISEKPVDVYFTGSMANYNYNDKSDIDLHLVYDFEQVGVNAEILSKYFQSAKKIFNSKYNITIKNIPVEVGVENKNEPLVSTAVYSLIEDDWIIKPDNANVEMAEPDAPYYQKIVNIIEEAIQSNDSKTIGNIWKFLGHLRKTSLANEGEFGAGNALFKKLRNMEYLNRLKDAYYNSVSRELSVEALEEIE